MNTWQIRRYYFKTTYICLTDVTINRQRIFMRIYLSIILLIWTSAAFAQNVEKDITEKSVQRVISTLAADDMLGRSARVPEQIEKAAVFLDNEFKSIGLEPLKGLTGYRQEFIKG